MSTAAHDLTSFSLNLTLNRMPIFLWHLNPDALKARAKNRRHSLLDIHDRAITCREKSNISKQKYKNWHLKCLPTIGILSDFRLKHSDICHDFSAHLSLHYLMCLVRGVDGAERVWSGMGLDVEERVIKAAPFRNLCLQGGPVRV